MSTVLDAIPLTASVAARVQIPGDSANWAVAKFANESPFQLRVTTRDGQQTIEGWSSDLVPLSGLDSTVGVVPTLLTPDTVFPSQQLVVTLFGPDEIPPGAQYPQPLPRMSQIYAGEKLIGTFSGTANAVRSGQYTPPKDTKGIIVTWDNAAPFGTYAGMTVYGVRPGGATVVIGGATIDPNYVLEYVAAPFATADFVDVFVTYTPGVGPGPVVVVWDVIAVMDDAVVEVVSSAGLRVWLDTALSGPVPVVTNPGTYVSVRGSDAQRYIGRGGTSDELFAANSVAGISTVTLFSFTYNTTGGAAKRYIREYMLGRNTYGAGTTSGCSLKLNGATSGVNRTFHSWAALNAAGTIFAGIAQRGFLDFPIDLSQLGFTAGETINVQYVNGYGGLQAIDVQLSATP